MYVGVKAIIMGIREAQAGLYRSAWRSARSHHVHVLCLRRREYCHPEVASIQTLNTMIWVHYRGVSNNWSPKPYSLCYIDYDILPILGPCPQLCLNAIYRTDCRAKAFDRRLKTTVMSLRGQLPCFFLRMLS